MRRDNGISAYKANKQFDRSKYLRNFVRNGLNFKIAQIRATEFRKGNINQFKSVYKWY